MSEIPTLRTDKAVKEVLNADMLNADEWQQKFGELANRMREIERELAEANKHWDNAISDFKQADADSIRALHERNEARKQRDALAEALRWAMSKEPSPCRCLEFATPPHVCPAHKALSTLNPP